MKHVAALAFVAWTIAAVATQSPSLDYTQWRGSRRDGGASGFTEPSVWPEKLTRKWNVVVGEGYATPLVIGKTVYAFTRVDGDEVMTALSAETGQRLWRAGYPAPYTPSQPTVAHGSGPKATPLFHEGKLFTLGISGIVAAFDVEAGALVWKTPAPAEPPYFSASSSPVGDAGVVIVHPGNYAPLTAFDAKAGTVKWTAGDDGLFASPIITELDGTRQVISLTQANLIGVSVPDGRVLWRYPFANNGGITPVVYRDTIIISALDLGVAAIRPSRRGDEWRVDRVWETKDVSMYLSNPVVIGDTLFGLSHRASGQFFALDAQTGKTLWLGNPREAANTACVKAGNLLFLLNDDAELIVARSNRERFEPLKRYQVADSTTWAQPAVSGDRLFIKDTVSLTLWTLGEPQPPLEDLIAQFERAGFVEQLKLGEEIAGRQDARVLSRLERGLRDDDRHARANVGLVFAALGDDRGYRTIAGILIDSSERPEGQGQGIPGGRWTSKRQIEADRYYAVHVLGHLKTRQSADLLLPLLEDRGVSYNAAWALGEVGDRRAVQPLMAALRDEDALVRVAAIHALEKLRATEALPQLRAMLTDRATPRAGDQIPVAETARRAIASLER